MKFIRKHVKLIIFIIICLLIFIIYTRNNKNNINYVSLGDGFSLGIDSYDIIDYGYSDYIKDYLSSEQLLNKYIKSFSSKEMSIEMLHDCILLNKNVDLATQNINIKESLREARLITITIGLNDLLYQLSINNNLTSSKIDEIVNRIELSFDELIKEIRKYYKYDIYVIGYYNVNPSNETLKEAIKQLNRIYKNNEDVIYIPTYDIFEKNQNYKSNPNNIYPNRDGYQAISQEIISKISKKLEKQKNN